MFGRFRKKAPQTDDDLDTNRAIDFFRRGDYQEALRRVDAMLAAGPDVALSWRFKGECLFSMGRYAEAVECFDEAASLGGPGTEDMFLWKSLCLYNGGHPEQAEAVLRDFITSGTGSPQLVAQAEAALRKLESLA
jgi:tetratricopeptide (TPR) repeat protein